MKNEDIISCLEAIELPDDIELVTECDYLVARLAILAQRYESVKLNINDYVKMSYGEISSQDVDLQITPFKPASLIGPCGSINKMKIYVTGNIKEGFVILSPKMLS